MGEWSTQRPGRFTPCKESQYPLFKRLLLAWVVYKNSQLRAAGLPWKVEWFIKRRELNSLLDRHPHVTCLKCVLFEPSFLGDEAAQNQKWSLLRRGGGGVGVKLRTLFICSVDSWRGIMTGIQARSPMELGSTSDTRRGICSLQCAERRALWRMEVEGSVAGGKAVGE